MFKRLLIVARDFNAAKRWALAQRLSPGAWVYISSYHNIRGNRNCEYVLLDGWKLRMDAELVKEELEKSECKNRDLLGVAPE